jgi:hypothetical protein
MKMEFFLHRKETTEDGTFGELYIDDCWLYTLELPWRNNATDVSCIPEGSYLCQLVDTPHHGLTYQVLVPGRVGVLFHSGNTEIDTKGCILLGLSTGSMDARDPDSGEIEKQPAVLQSKEAFKLFMDRMNGTSSFVLHISTNEEE